MKVCPTPLPSVLVVIPDVFGDERGFFMEMFRAARYADAGITATFVQDNVSRSRRGVLRGLHLQHPRGQAKLISVLDGEVFDVAVDARVGSPTFARWHGEYLSSGNRHQLFVPAGFAHGFLVTSDVALVSYKCSEYYEPESELSVRWNDPGIGIEWPVADVELSTKDRSAAVLSAIPTGRLPRYGA